MIVVLKRYSIVIYSILINFVYLFTAHFFFYFQYIYGIVFEREESLLKGIISFLFVLFFALLMQKYFCSNDFFSYMIAFLFCLYFIPNNANFVLFKQDTKYYCLIIFYWFFLNLFAIFFSRVDFRLFRKSIIISRIKILVLFFFFILLIYIMAKKIQYNGLAISFSLNEMYDIRQSFMNWNRSFGGTFGVIKDFTGLVLFPVFMCYALEKRSVILIIGCVIGQFTVFSLAFDKVQMLMLLVILGCFLVTIVLKIKKYFLIYFGVLCSFLVCMLESIILDSVRFYTIVVRRLFFIPAFLNELYYDFFRYHSKLYWREGVPIIHNFFSPIYGKNPIQLIALEYFKTEKEHPNNGLFSEAYMHFGALGVVLYPFILVLILKIFDSETRRFSPLMKTILTICLGSSLLSNPITMFTPFCIIVGSFFLCVILDLLLRLEMRE